MAKYFCAETCNENRLRQLRSTAVTDKQEPTKSNAFTEIAPRPHLRRYQRNSTWCSVQHEIRESQEVIMNIVVCIKQVPDTTEVRLDPKTNAALIREGVPASSTQTDLSGLEVAFALKTKIPKT